MKIFKGLILCFLIALLLITLQNSAFSQEPQLVFPAYQEDCVNKQLDFVWTSQPGALSYTIQVSLTQDFSALVLDMSNLSDTVQNAVLPHYNSTYFWKVSAVYPSSSASSSVFSFTVKHQEPTPLHPADGLSAQPLDFKLIWTKQIAPDYYNLQIAADENFTTLFENIDLPDTVYNADPLLTAFNQDYYWRVRGHYGTCPSNWSEIRNFKTVFDEPVLLSPSVLEDCVPLTSTFSWTAVLGAVGYRIQISDTVSFARIEIEDTSNATKKQLTLPQSFKTYFWRVRADDNSNYGLWSSARQFKTTISTPLLTDPANFSPSLKRNEAVLLEWNFEKPDASPAIYHLQIANSNDFAPPSIIVDEINLGTTNYSFIPTDYSKTYYWRVMANHLSCFSAWSAEWSFKTEFEAPNLINPPDNQTCSPLEATFEWTPSGDAKKYRLQIANGPDIDNSIIYNNPDISTTNYSVVLPDGMTDYYWRVRAEDSSSTGLWSSRRKLTTTMKSPELTSPLNHTGGLIKDSIVPLNWNASDPSSLQPQTYTLQVAREDTNFSAASLVVDQTNIYSLTYNFVPLDYSVNYYWRVRTNYGACESAWSQYWHLKSEYYEPMLVSPADNEECVSLSPVFKWTAIPNAYAYRIQVSDSVSFGNLIKDLANIRADSAMLELPQGLTWYYWRVRAEDSTSVGIWSGYKKFKTTVDKPVLVSPLDNANSMPLSNELKWRVLSPADSFLVQVTMKNDFHPDSLLFELVVSNPTNNFMSVVANTTLHNTRYWWRVRILSDIDECGSQWSETWSFRTLYTKPILLAPASLSSCLPITSEYLWRSIPNVTKYRFQISDEADFSSILVNIGDISDTSIIARAPLGFTKLYWRVRADDEENAGAWSDTRSYTSAVMDPTAIFPEDGQANLPLNFVLQWKDEAPQAVYHLQLSKYEDFHELMIDLENLRNSYYEVSLPEYHRNYYWRVLAKISSCSSIWSDVWTFNTSLAPPYLIYPDDEAENIPLTVIFRWELKEPADSYSFNLSTDSTFASSSIVLALSGLIEPQCAAINLIPDTVYYWRVNATSSLGTSVWSEVYSFRTAVLGPDVPYLHLPENGTEKTDTDLSLQWLAAPRAISYDLQVSLNASFTEKVVDETGLTELIYPLNDLRYDQTYYWRVRAANDSGKTKWSYVWFFTTIQLAPDAKPLLWTPDNSVDNAAISLIFSWYPVNRAVGYQLQIASQMDFEENDKIVDIEPIYATSRIVAGFEYDKKYFWRVRAFNSGGYGPWADPYNFTTIPDPASVDEEFVRSLNISVVPNPILETATLTFNMERSGFANIKLVNILGQVEQIISNKELAEGENRFVIAARSLQTGTYFISIETAGRIIFYPVILNR